MFGTTKGENWWCSELVMFEFDNVCELISCRHFRCSTVLQGSYCSLIHRYGGSKVHVRTGESRAHVAYVLRFLRYPAML